jgi:hypothetical protein
MLIIILVSMSCLYYRQERTHILFQRGPLLQIWAVGVERGIYGGYWLCVSSFILKILGWNCVKANSCEKFEAKISEKSEKKGSEYMKRTSESHVKRISVRLLFALKRKIFLSETGAPYSWSIQTSLLILCRRLQISLGIIALFVNIYDGEPILTVISNFGEEVQYRCFN